MEPLTYPSRKYLFRHVFNKNVGNENPTKFWNDHWIDEFTFRDRFTRLYALKVDNDCLVKDRLYHGS